MLKSFVVAIALLMPALANAQNWTRVVDDREGSIDVDVASIRRFGTAGSQIEAWTLWNWSSPKSIEGTGVIWKTKYRSQKMLHWYDCGRATLALRQVASYSKADGAGDVVDSNSWEQYPVTYSSIPPESTGRALLDFVCRR